MTRINLVKSTQSKAQPVSRELTPIVVLRFFLVAIFVVLLGLLIKSQDANAAQKSLAQRQGKIVKASKADHNKLGRELYCSSSSGAPVYLGRSGTWILKGQVVSDFTLKDLSLKNRTRGDLGSLSERASRDHRVQEERSFLLKPDPFCNYELAMPRDFSGEKSFNARLVQTCDNMFDGTAELNCNIRD